MKKSLLAVILAATGLWPLSKASFLESQASAPARSARAAADGLALTPPMGWYPWNAFGEAPQNEALIREIAAAMVSSGLKDAGYAYVGPDEGICFSRGGDGLLAPNLERYPSGLRGLGDAIHKMGLKYALYTDAGTHTCSRAMPGTKGRESEDMRVFADWRADYIKIDWCNTQGQDIVQSYTLLHEAQRAAGRPLVHSLCSWGEGYPWVWAAPVGHMWRTTADICAPGQADWARAVRIAFANEKLAAFAGPGHWNDPDMMVVGMPGLTDAQNRALFSLWAVMAAPLIAGNDVRRMSKEAAAILTNLEAIAVDQDPLGIQGKILWNDGNISLWGAKPLFDGSQAILVFNQARYPVEQRIAWREIGRDSTDRLYVRNIWTHETAGPMTGGVTVKVEPDGVAFLRVSQAGEFPLPPVIVADTYLLTFKAKAGSSEKLVGRVTLTDKGGADLPLWKVRGPLPGWLSVEADKKGDIQTLVNTVNPSGLKKGVYHALVRADNIEPRSRKPVTSVYYDLDLEIL